jgi:hypothetical protein
MGRIRSTGPAYAYIHTHMHVCMHAYTCTGASSWVRSLVVHGAYQKHWPNTYTRWMQDSLSSLVQVNAKQKTFYLCIYVCVYIYTHMYVCMYTKQSERTYMHTYMHMHGAETCMHEYIQTNIHTYT